MFVVVGRVLCHGDVGLVAVVTAIRATIIVRLVASGVAVIVDASIVVTVEQAIVVILRIIASVAIIIIRCLPRGLTFVGIFNFAESWLALPLDE